jgi:phage tail-like protein
MAAQYAQIDPYLAAKFWVEIDGIVHGFFTECTGLGAQTEVEEYAEGGLNDFMHKLPGRTKYTNVTLKRGWVDSDDLWLWYQKTISGQLETRRVSIILFNNKVQSPADPKSRWDLIQAYPVRWQGPDFRLPGTTTAVETLEIAYHGWQRQ